MSVRKPTVGIVLANLLLFALLLLWHDTGVLTLAIRQAKPLLPLALLIAFSMFAGELPSALCGLAVGIFLDSVSSVPFGFHSLTFFLIAGGTAFITHYLFNNNIRAAIALCLAFSCLYFLLRWLFLFRTGLSFDSRVAYLLQTTLPSALYTALFSIPFYYTERALFRRLAE